MTGTSSTEEQVRRLAEEQYLALVKVDERGAGDFGDCRLVDPLTGTPMSAVSSKPTEYQSLADIERELRSGEAAAALQRCQDLFAQAASHGLTLEQRPAGGAWIWNAREVCGMPVASDMSYDQLMAFLRKYEKRPLIVASSAAEPAGQAALDFSLSAY